MNEARVGAGEQQTHGRRVDIAHEALIGGWEQLRQWLNERRDAELIRRRLESKTEEWVRLGQGTSGLLDAVELAEAETWLAGPDAVELGPSEALPLLVQASQSALERAQQEREAAEQHKEEIRARELEQAKALAAEQGKAARRLRLLVVVVALAALVAGALAVWARMNAEQAQLQRMVATAAERTAVAERSRADAARIEAEAQAQVARAQFLAAEAPQQHEVGEDERGALLARQSFLYSQDVGGPARAAADMALRSTTDAPSISRILRDQDGPVTSVTFGPIGKLLVGGGGDGVVRLWNLDDLDAEPVSLFGHRGAINAMAINQEGRILASGGADTDVRLWDLTNLGADPLILTGHEDAITSLAFQPHAQTLVSGSQDGTVRSWDLTRPTDHAVTLISRDAGVTSVAFSPDGASLVASTGNLVLLWNLSNLASPPAAVFISDTGDIGALVFSPDGQRLAVGGEDGTVWLLNMARLEEDPVELNGHGDQVTSATFSPDSEILASGSLDGTVRLWEPAGPASGSVVLKGKSGQISSVAFSPDGQLLASDIDETTIQLWITHAETLADLVCERTTRNLTLAEWRQFVGEDVPYTRTCLNIPPGEVSFPLGEASAYVQAVQMGAETDDPALNNDTCWFGTLDGFPDVVRPACDRAVSLAPADGCAYDSRGVARALTGDYGGAIGDFEHFLSWEATFNQADEVVAKRTTWIAELKEGRIPFDSETVKELKMERIKCTPAGASATPAPVPVAAILLPNDLIGPAIQSLGMSLP